MDALARWKTGSRNIDERFMTFAQQELISFADESRAEQLYTAFRNGLIHEGRIKAGAQFSFDYPRTCEDLDGVLVINPTFLAKEIEAALKAFVAELRSDHALRAQLARRLAHDHKDDRRFR
jgi:hypothetical protein